MVDALILALREVGNVKPKMSFIARPWFEIFKPGEYTLETLQREFRETSIGIFLFTRDEKRLSRGEKKWVTRENVLLEYGLFLSQNSRQNALLLAEDDVAIPTDLSGIVFRNFKSDETTTMEAEFRVILREMKDRIASAPHQDLERPSRLGFANTLKKVDSRLSDIRLQLQFLDRKKLGGPIIFDNSASVSTYSEALDACRESFCTTTFLTSGFWTRNDPQVQAANQSISIRLGSSGNVRRIFLLGRPRHEEIHVWQIRIKHLRQSRDDKGIQQLNSDLVMLRRHITQMVTDGCQVRVGYDGTRAYNQVPDPDQEMQLRPLDTEIAIYDNFRVDFFSGGGVGEITKVRCFSEVSSGFSACLAGAKSYFQTLWSEAEPASSYLEELRRAVDSAIARIHYTSNWLMTYEICLPQEDRKLKDAELNRVKSIVADWWQRKRLRSVRLLDIGTCTARYPLELNQLFPDSEQVELVGIDDDEDALRVAKEKASGINRIRILRWDFLESGSPFDEDQKFDVITCMLGTISHFCAESDNLQKSIVRIRDLLADEGLLFIGSWSDFAVGNKQLLSIYSADDCQRLVRWTPSESAIGAELRRAGFNTVAKEPIESRIKLFTCEV